MLDWLALGLLLHYPFPADQNAGIVVSASSGIEIVSSDPKDLSPTITLYQPVHDCLKLIVELLDRLKPNTAHAVPLHTRHQGAGFDIDRSKLSPAREYDIVWTLETLQVRGKLRYSFEDSDENRKDWKFLHISPPLAVLAETKKPDD